MSAAARLPARLAGAPDLAEICAAARRIAGLARRTPLIESAPPRTAPPCPAGAPLPPKLDGPQPIGGIKLRGALNAVAQPSPQDRARGVIRRSTDNHGRALARAARQAGARAAIRLSVPVAQTKVAAVEALGPRAIRVGRSQPAAQPKADHLSAQEGLVAIPPFDHADVIARQGAPALELPEDRPDHGLEPFPLAGGPMTSPADDPILILSEAELRRACPLELAAMEATEGGIAALARGGAAMPAVLSMDPPQTHGEVDVKTAWLPGSEAFALKVSPGLFDNPGLGLPSPNGLMVALSSKTSLAQAIFLDNGWLTNLRTAATGVLRGWGGGWGGGGEMAGAREERGRSRAGNRPEGPHAAGRRAPGPALRVLVWGRDPVRAAACAQDIDAATGAEARVSASAPAALQDAPLVVTAPPPPSRCCGPNGCIPACL